MSKTIKRVLWSLVAIALIVSLSLPQYFYLKGLDDVPENRDPLSELSIPTSVSQAYWRYIGGAGEPKMEPKNPYEFLFDFFVLVASDDNDYRWTAEYDLLSWAARSVMFREKFSGDWHLSNASALIWISRNWTVDETIATVLQTDYFGHGFRGIDEAAVGYFGRSLERISEAETVYLLVITPGPSRRDPWCNPSTHSEIFSSNAARIGLDVEYDSIEVLRAPLDACRDSN